MDTFHPISGSGILIETMEELVSLDGMKTGEVCVAADIYFPFMAHIWQSDVTLNSSLAEAVVA